MADFSLRTLFVIPVGNTLPTSGSIEDLTDGQTGVFKDKTYTAATAGNISTASFIQIAQGRKTTSSPGYGLGPKISDRIALSKVKKWYKVTGHGTAVNEIWDFSTFSAQCEEDITFTIRGHSKFLDATAFNGFTRSVTIKTPCCDCGADPCATVANETIVDLLMAAIAAEATPATGQPLDSSAINMSTYFTFTKVGTSSSAKIRVEAKPLTAYGKFCDVALNPYTYDRIFFQGWVYKNPDVTVDFISYDRCEQAGVATLVQRSSYPIGTSDAIAQMQIDYYSYQSDFKHQFRFSEYNQKFEDYVTAGTVYDSYVIIYDSMTQDSAWNDVPKIDETVIIAVPAGSQSSGLSTVLSVYLGTIVDESGAAITTSSTTTAAPTTTTTTTTLIP